MRNTGLFDTEKDTVTDVSPPAGTVYEKTYVVCEDVNVWSSVHPALVSALVVAAAFADAVTNKTTLLPTPAEEAKLTVADVVQSGVAVAC